MPQDSQSAWTTLAHLLRPQGRKGEILAELYTNFPERFHEYTNAFLAPPRFAGPVSGARPTEVSGFWLPTGRNHGRIVLAFNGVESIAQAELLTGLDLMIPSSERLELEPGAEYVDDLVGCTVFDGDTPVGIVESVGFTTSPDGARRLPDVAPLLTLITSEGNELLVPFVQNFVVRIDTSDKRIEMVLPAGLLELNRPDAKP